MTSLGPVLTVPPHPASPCAASSATSTSATTPPPSVSHANMPPLATRAPGAPKTSISLSQTPAPAVSRPTRNGYPCKPPVARRNACSRSRKSPGVSTSGHGRRSLTLRSERPRARALITPPLPDPPTRPTPTNPPSLFATAERLHLPKTDHPTGTWSIIIYFRS